MKASIRRLSILSAAVVLATSRVVAYSDSGCVPDIAADGRCDDTNNNAECDYDGGDCCKCTCVPVVNPDDPSSESSCTNNFACIDPEAPCVDEDDVTIDTPETCSREATGNAICNDYNNNAECDYDGGDCCECTCDDSLTDARCGEEGGFACIDPDAPCVSDDDMTVDMIDICDTATIGNSLCDEMNNNAECNYDGGDCCECTCVPDETQLDDYYSCGPSNGFACIDPDAPCVNDDDVTIDIAEGCDAIQIGNGWCDDNNNKPECNYDGGDCCECTCMVEEPYGDDDDRCSRHSGFACIDPSAPCVDDDSVTGEMIDICNTVDIGDGFCDASNNNADCAYDGGDCCECTCVGFGADDDCTRNFACIDPGAACVTDDDITADMFENCGFVLGIGNALCDEGNNNAECGYDGGDCCECTCVLSADTASVLPLQGCQNFACIDPDAACVNDDDVTEDMYENCGYVAGFGNGSCEPDNNTEECGYDGGDCCSCTCGSGITFDDDYACGPESVFDCKDETAPCFGEDDTHGDDDQPMSYGFVPWEQDDAEPLSYGFTPWEQEGDLPTVDGAVEAGEMTEVAVMATAYDVRPGASSGMVGCGEAGGNGCEPLNSRDGISSEIESRWSCASKIVPDGGPCQIEYTFAEAQDIIDIQVAFWKGNERIRTLEVHFDGLPHHTHESYAGTTFNSLGVEGTDVTTVMLQSIDLLPDEWISLIEVLIFVVP